MKYTVRYTVNAQLFIDIEAADAEDAEGQFNNLPLAELLYDIDDSHVTLRKVIEDD